MKKINSKLMQKRVANQLFEFMKERLSHFLVEFKQENDGEWEQVVIYVQGARFLNSIIVREAIKCVDEFRQEHEYGENSIDFYMDIRETVDSYCRKIKVAVFEIDVKIAED